MSVQKFTFHSLAVGKRPPRERRIPRERERLFFQEQAVGAGKKKETAVDSPKEAVAGEGPDSLVSFTINVKGPKDCLVPWWRVLVSNDVGDKQQGNPDHSVVSTYGHVEKSCVIAHLVGTALYALVYAPIRQTATPMGKSTSTPALLGLAAVLGNAFCLFLSSLYHVYSPTEWAPFIRPLDYLGIYTSAALTTIGEVGIISSPSGGVSWQSYADPALAAAFLWIFFAVRRSIVRKEGSHVYYTTDDGCVFGFARRVYVDGAHACLRACGSTLLVFAWIYVLAAPSPHLSDTDKQIFYGTRGVGTLLLVLGMLVDNTVPVPDIWQNREAAMRFSCPDRECGCGIGGRPPLVCGGCVMNAHFWWHAISLVAMIVATAGTEWLIGSYPALRE